MRRRIAWNRAFATVRIHSNQATISERIQVNHTVIGVDGYAIIERILCIQDERTIKATSLYPKIYLE